LPVVRLALQTAPGKARAAAEGPIDSGLRKVRSDTIRRGFLTSLPGERKCRFGAYAGMFGAPFSPDHF